jgi:hypothetical protein
VRALRDGPRLALRLIFGVLALPWIFSPSQAAAQPTSTAATVGPDATSTGVPPAQPTGSQPAVGGSADPAGQSKDSTLSVLLGSLASLATVLGVPIAIVAAFLAIRSLRSQATSQKLEAILTTNNLWKELQDATSDPVSLSAETVSAVQNIYRDLMSGPGHSSLDGAASGVPFTQLAPFVVGALLPRGVSTRERAPADEEAYSADLQARALVIGYVRTLLEDERCRPTWMDTDTSRQISKDLAKLDDMLTVWVNKMNEIAELYEGHLMDRRRFVGKRSASLVRLLFTAEPHILWRNSVTSGRWGIRVLGIGGEARLYHWCSPLQQASLRLTGSNPAGFEPTPAYDGWSVSVGWAIGSGSAEATETALRSADRKIRRRLGQSFSNSGKIATYNLVKQLPRDASSGLELTTLTWFDVARDPAAVREAVRLLGR